MLEIPRALLSRVKAGESREELEQYLMNNYPIPQIIKAFAELIVVSDDASNKPQILVTQEELDAINALFRVRGQRLVDGEVRRETRGRPRMMK